MPSKGVICFSYNAQPGVEIEFSVPKHSVVKRDLHTYTQDHLEIDTKQLGTFKFSGRFSFTVRRDGREVTNQWVDVNALTGGLENGTMRNMEQTPSVFSEGLIVAYGFYDSGPGVAGLPKQHLCYVTVTRDYSDWMKDVVPPGSDKENRPFNRMVLPSSHDIGMNSLQTAQAILQQAGTGIIQQALGSVPYGLAVLQKLGNVSDSIIKAVAPDIIRALAVTQKDTLPTVLALGARYFEFRPARCLPQMQAVSPLPDTWYFQHGAIPGMMYKAFLTDVVQFLLNNTAEIIVVQNRWDGVPAACPRPNDDDLRTVLEDVLREKNVGDNLVVGNLDDMMNKTIRDLRNEKRRLIVTRDVNQISNYDDAANATLTGEPILNALNNLSNNVPRGHPIVLLQCQATATNIKDVVVYSALTSDASTSPILATKPICDSKILPALNGDLGTRLQGSEGVVVVLNDFFDGATADVGTRLCAGRLG